MPQATDEQRDKMGEYFGDRIDDSGPYLFLITQGFKDKDGWWTHPTKKWKEMSQKEKDCLYFLADEWDYAFDFTE